MIKKIISGGQTGADQGGLEAGKELGLQTGGTAPAGYRTELGPRYDLLRGFALTEGLKGSTIADDYRSRTEQNIKDSDGTIVFGDFYSPGTRMTIAYCSHSRKPLYRVCREDNPIIEKTDLLKWLDRNNINVLNVAGNRESKNPGLKKRVRNFLITVLRG